MPAFERISPVIEPRDPIDEVWNTRLRETLASDVVYKLLGPENSEISTAKEAFFASGRTANPDLRPKLGHSEIDDEEQRLLDLKSDIIADGALDPPVQQGYRWRVNELIAGLRMLRAAATGDTRRFDRYNTFIYGQPDPEIFAATADWFRKEAAGLSGHESEAVQEAAKNVLGLVPDMNGDSGKLLPEETAFQHIRGQHYRQGGHYALLFAGVALPEKGPVKPEVGEPILQQVRHNLGADGYEIVDSGSKTWSVSHNPPQLERPASYSMPLKRFVGLGPGHEWTHVLERINGDRQPLRLSGYGLDRYENGNEGRSIIREQVPFETIGEFGKQLRWHDIMRRHFAISLAVGVDGEKRDFSKTFQIVNAVDRLRERVKNPDDIEVADRKADERTWSLLTRVLKGTDGTGGAYLKDKVYLEGNVACWRVAREHPELIEQGDLGKFDITNPRHIALLQATGVLPKVK